jgi:transcriptional antiterminator
MARRGSISPYDSLIEFIIAKISAEDILAYHASDEEQERAEELTCKNKNGTLTPKERHELDLMMQLESIVVVLLKARALESKLRKDKSRLSP